MRRALLLVALLSALGLALAHEDQTRALLLGVGTGALVAAIALSVVLTARGSGVVNFAAGAVAMYAAYLYDGLRRSGDVFLPPLPNPLGPIEGITGVTLPDWPTTVSLGGPMSFWPALLITLVAAALAGLVFHLLVFRPLRHAPPLAKIVASVGLMIVLQAIVTLRFGGTPRPVQPVLDKKPVSLPRDVTIPQDQLQLAALVVIVAAVLWAVFRFTRFGLATRAAAENEKGAIVLGFAPDMLAGVNWLVSTTLAALMGVLVATVNTSIDPITVTLLIVPALGAALLGGFSSFGVVTASGIGIAMAQTWVQFLSTKSWFPHAGTGAFPGVKDALPFVVIAIVLFVRGERLPSRASLSPGRLPSAPQPANVVPAAVVLSVLSVAGLVFLGPAWRLAITNTLIGTLLCLSLVVVTGFVGQISLAQMTLAGVAGFAVSKLATEHDVGFPFGPLLGALVATGFGVVAAVPALRVRGVNLAVVTLAAAVAIEKVVFTHPTWAGGIDGAPVPPPSIFGVEFGPNDGRGLDDKLPNPWFGVACLVIVVALALAVVALRRAPLGRRMLAVRANERAAAAAGVNVARTKLAAFAIAAFVAGVAGSLSGYRFGAVTPAFFGSLASLTLLAFAYLGGISSVGGAVIGGCLVSGGLAFTALNEWFGVGDEYTLLLGGLGLLATAVVNPEGIAGSLRRLRLPQRAGAGSRLPSLRHAAVGVET